MIHSSNSCTITETKRCGSCNAIESGVADIAITRTASNADLIVLVAEMDRCSSCSGGCISGWPSITEIIKILVQIVLLKGSTYVLTLRTFLLYPCNIVDIQVVHPHLLAHRCTEIK